MPSIPHFRDLSLRNKILVYQSLTRGFVSLREKMDGVFIAFRWEFPVNSYGIADFPGILSFKSYNSPWVTSGKDYLYWAGSEQTFSTWFAKVIDELRNDSWFRKNVFTEMISLNQNVLTAELFSQEIMEVDLDSQTMKMIRINYPISVVNRWDRWSGHHLFFHDGQKIQSPAPIRFYGPLNFSEKINSLLADHSIEELISTKKTNAKVRNNLNDFLTKWVEGLLLSKTHFHSEGVVGTTFDKIRFKVVNPNFMSLSLNQNLFEGK